MKPYQVTLAAAKLEQIRKLKEFLKRGPMKPDTVTITFREGKESKSLSLRDDAVRTMIESIIENIHQDTKQKLVDLGVDITDGYS